jgi:two-component system, OmpR family, copper resistance phosphate regulon response regulator CusR
MSTASQTAGMSILLADDDAQLATFLSKSLETAGYAVQTAPDEGSVVRELQRQNFQLIILDLNFGQTDGLILLERLRTEGLETPVIVLSARNRLADRIRSFKLGADDYVTKPFSFQELAARASALLRRKADPALSILRSEDLELDPASRKVHRGSREIKLSPKEFDMLVLLLRRGGNTVSRQDLLRECWGQELESDSNLVDVYVNYLRKKVDAPQEEKLIHTVRGAGYRLGKLASQRKAAPESTPGNWAEYVAADLYPEEENAESGKGVYLQTPLRTMVHSVTHDLAQPLTSVRCFLESLAIGKNMTPAEAAELRMIEQQADRAIALAKTISVLVREVPVPTQSTLPLQALLNAIFDNLSVLLHSGLFAVERSGDANLHVTSNPVLHQLIVLLISKLVGRISRPLLLTISAGIKNGRCQITLAWKAMDSVPALVADARSVLARDLESIREIAASLSGEFSFPESQPEFSLTLPSVSPGSGPTAAVH